MLVFVKISSLNSSRFPLFLLPSWGDLHVALGVFWENHRQHQLLRTFPEVRHSAPNASSTSIVSPWRVRDPLFSIPDGVVNHREKQSSWGRFPKFPFQIQGLRFLPWTECRKLVPSSLFWKREDMESKWKMELNPKEPSLWLGMIPGKNMRRGGRSILEGKANLCFIQTSPGPKGPAEANRNSEKQRHLKHGGNPWSPCPW